MIEVEDVDGPLQHLRLRLLSRVPDGVFAVAEDSDLTKRPALLDQRDLMLDLRDQSGHARFRHSGEVPRIDPIGFG